MRKERTCTIHIDKHVWLTADVGILAPDDNGPGTQSLGFPDLTRYQKIGSSILDEHTHFVHEGALASLH